MNEEQKKIISQWYSEISKRGHQKHPRPREFYVEMGKLGGKKGKGSKKPRISTL